MTSIVYLDIDFTDLLCEMSQKYGGLILNENWNGKRCWTQVNKEKDMH